MTVSALGFSSFNNDSAAAASSSSTMSKYRRKTSSSASSSPAAAAAATARNTTNKNYGGTNNTLSSSQLSSSAGSTSLQFSTYLSSSSSSSSPQDDGDGNQPLDPSQKNNNNTSKNFRQLIEKVARVNLESAGDGLASFQPLGYAKSAFLENKENFEPLSSTVTDTAMTDAAAPPAVFGPPLLPLIPRSTDNERERRQYIPSSSSPGTETTNYATSYLNQVRTSMADSAAAAAADNSSSSSASAKILEKLNYMIFLLEEQQNQRTNNVTEEFIMYLFLGIFMIFLVDCFHRRP